MSTLKVGSIRGVSASSDAITVANDGTCIANVTNNLSNKNIIINGSMIVDQRSNGNSADTTGASYLSCDRFGAAYAAASKFTMQQVASTLAGFEKALKITSSGTTSSASQHYLMRYSIEGHDSARLALGTSSAKTFTLSFYVKGSIAGDYSVAFANGSDNRVYATTYTINSADTWERKTITLTGDTSGTWATNNTEGMEIKWDLGSGSNFNVSAANQWVGEDKLKVSGTVNLVATNAATLEFTGVQLEIGSNATDFEYRSFSQELALCQRYFEIAEGGFEGPVYGTDSNMKVSVPFKVQKRANPTLASISASENCCSSTTVTANSFDETLGARVQGTNVFLDGSERFFYVKFSAAAEL